MTFIPLDAFPEFRSLQENHAVIRDESSRIRRWVKWESDARDVSGHCRFLSGEWTVFPAYVAGNARWESFFAVPDVPRSVIESALSRLPETFPQLTRMLRGVPRVRWAGFSRLGARSALQPHRHTNPGSLIYHLGVVIPPNRMAGLTADGRIHIWEKAGDAVIFDDNYLHSAWNDSDSERIVLYINFSRETAAASP